MVHAFMLLCMGIHLTGFGGVAFPTTDQHLTSANLLHHTIKPPDGGRQPPLSFALRARLTPW